MNTLSEKLYRFLLIFFLLLAWHPIIPASAHGFDDHLGGSRGALPLVGFSVSSSTVGEDMPFAAITVTLSESSFDVITVQLDTSNGTAQAGSDYTDTNALLSFLPGETTQVVQVPILEDPLDEDNETFVASLSNPTHADLGIQITHEVTILDNDIFVGVRVRLNQSAYTISEGVGLLGVSVVLTATSPVTVTVDYHTTGVTAIANSDYTPITGTLTFAPGETSKTLSVPVIDDTSDESNEVFTLSITDPVNATLGTPHTATITILDDDAPPTVQWGMAAFAVRENQATVNVSVTLSVASGRTILVDCATIAGTASAGSDYMPITQTLTFAAGETSQVIVVGIIDDALDEENEGFTLSLTNPVNAILGTPGIASVTIQDDDPLPTVQLSAATISVGEGEATAAVTVTLAAASSRTIFVDYETTSGTAVTGADYTPISGTLAFAPGETNQALAVVLLDDMLDEEDENFTIAIGNPVNATLGTPDSTQVTIIDNDPYPSIQLTVPATVVSENDGTATLTVTLSTASAKTVQVDYETTAGTATAGNDYMPLSGTLIFAPGETGKTLSVLVLADLLHEGDESFALSIADPVNATLGTPHTATITIQDGNLLPSLQLSNANLAVDELDTTATFTVTLSMASAQPIQVSYNTTAVTASENDDYTPIRGTLTFAPGETRKALSVTLWDDAVDENDETLTLALANPVNATLGALSTATVTIQDDDLPPSVQIHTSVLTVTEDVATATLTVTLSAESAKVIEVGYKTVAGTAAANDDYTPLTGTLTFMPGETVQSVTIVILDDQLVESTEDFTFVLENISNATPGTIPATTISITDNDLAPVGYRIFIPLVVR